MEDQLDLKQYELSKLEVDIDVYFNLVYERDGNVNMYKALNHIVVNNEMD